MLNKYAIMILSQYEIEYYIFLMRPSKKWNGYLGIREVVKATAEIEVLGRRINDTRSKKTGSCCGI